MRGTEGINSVMDYLCLPCLRREGGVPCVHIPGLTCLAGLLGWLHSPAGSRVSFSSSLLRAEGPGQCLKGHLLQMIALV